MMKSKINRVWILAILLLTTNVSAAGKLKVVATLPDLHYIAEQIGGDKVSVSAIAKGYQDPHFVDAKPSFVLKLKKADVFIQVGLDLEIGWVPPLLETARNSDIYFGGKGYVDASRGVALLEIPTTAAAQLRAEGDIHIFGNPHYWLDPENGKIVAANIARVFSAIRPELHDTFQQNLDLFSARIDSAMHVWEQKMEPYRGTKIVAYHNSWPYFENRFGLDVVAFIEPKPGVPPSPSHLVSVIRKMRQEKSRIIIISPYFDDKPAKSIASRTAAEVVSLAPSVGAFPEVKTYFDLFDYNLDAIIRAIEKTKP